MRRASAPAVMPATAGGRRTLRVALVPSGRGNSPIAGNTAASSGSAAKRSVTRLAFAEANSGPWLPVFRIT